MSFQRYEVVCTENYWDIGIAVEKTSITGKPSVVLGRASRHSSVSPYDKVSNYGNCGQYGGVELCNWIHTGIFLTLEEWKKISYERDGDSILHALGIPVIRSEVEEIKHKAKSEPEEKNEDETRISGIVFEHGKDDYGLWEGFDLSPEDESAIWQILEKYNDRGCSVRGTRKDIADEINGTDQWKEGYAQALKDFSENVNGRASAFILEHQNQLDFVSGVGMIWRFIDEAEEELKQKYSFEKEFERE